MNTSIIAKNLTAVRTNAPLVHNITNYVVMNNTANALLAIGASPVMAHAVEEVEEIVSISSALVLNIGTLSPTWIDAMLKAGRKATELQKPIVLDPVGAGASLLRTTTCQHIIHACRPTIIRGNASEIMAIANTTAHTKGVDATVSSNAALASAQQLAQSLACVVVVSGAIDYITDGNIVLEVHNGSAMMTKVTGMGCTATALIGAFAGVTTNYLEAAYSAMVVMGVAGEIAAKKSAGTGSFQVNFLDVLYQLNAQDIAHTSKIYEPKLS